MKRAIETFHVGDLCITRHSELEDDDELVTGREHLFEDVPAAEDDKPARRRAAK